jgi:serine/threonine protein kinase
MDTTAIRQIGRYRLIDVIGQGGMGVVYRAVDESIDRQVAIKMLLGSYAGDKDLLARFHREVRSTANLQHKNIVTVYALDDFEGFPYMVMEYLEGQSMGELIASRKPLSIVEKLRLISQVCEGLQYAHERNIIHRDVKPANILVLKDGTVKIVDFGIARVGQNETQTLTHTGQIIGSIYYMSPEQLTSPGIVDARTDIYSTGVTLFQFLTGELPFKSPDNEPHGTILKILNDPPPSLSKYLTNLPAGLDDVIRTSMAKDANLRYQTAEDFGYELSRIQESLKHEMIAELLGEARHALEERDLDAARRNLQEILKFEKRNPEANKLFEIVREQIQKQQRSVQVAHFQSQAQMALVGMQYEEALECIEQARRLDPDNPELIESEASIKRQLERSRELAEALRRGQAALYAGDLEEAAQEVGLALQIDGQDTEARTLEELIRKELEERSRRAQLQAFVEKARHEISDRNYLSALHALKEAHAIDPSDSNIQELLNWAQRGHEQEKLRSELHQYIDEIGRHIAENRYSNALDSCEKALQRFPNDASLEKLRQLAQRQKDAAEIRRAIEEVCVRARQLADEDNVDQAILVLEEGLGHFPDEPMLLSLLVNTQAENERRLREREEGERHLRVLSAQSAPPESVHKTSPTLAIAADLQSGIRRNISMGRLRAVAEQLRKATTQEGTARPENTQVSFLLSEFELRLAKWEKDLDELEGIGKAMQGARDLAAIESLADRARFLRDLHAQDEVICAKYERISDCAEQLRADRERVNVKCLEFLRSIQGSQDLQELAAQNKRVDEAALRWIDDPAIRSLVNQIAAYVEEVATRKKRVLDELNRLETSFTTARSAGQVGLLEQQARMLAADFMDADVDAALQRLNSIVREKLLQIEQTLGELKELSSKVDKAQRLEEIEQCQVQAGRLLERNSLSEEATDLLQRIYHQCEERRKEYGRVQENLNRLIESAENARDQAQLDLILARRRDLLKHFADDSVLHDLTARLEQSVAARREILRKTAREEEETFTLADLVDGSPATAPTLVLAAGTGAPVKGKSRKWVYPIAGAFGLTVVIAVLYALLPKSVRITVNPADAMVTIDSERCSNPCTPKLSLGTHKIEVSRPGFVTQAETIHVGLNGAVVPAISLPELPNPPVVIASPPAPAQNQPQLVVRTPVPGVSVFLDNSTAPAGVTDAIGQLQVPTTARLHHVRVQKNGYGEPAAQTVRVKAEGQTVAWFNLTMLPAQRVPEPVQSSHAPEQAKSESGIAPPPQPQETFLVIQAPFGAEIHIDQQLAGHSTGGPFKTRVEPGLRTVEVFLAGHQPYTQVVTVTAGQQGDVLAKLTPVSTPSAPGMSDNPKPSGGSSTVSDEDRRQIQLLLDRYADGFSHKNIKTIQSAWPSIPSEAVKRIREFFKLSKSVDMRIRLNDAIPAGRRVTVDYSQTLRYLIEGKETTDTENKTLYVLKTEGVWIIDFIPTT